MTLDRALCILAVRAGVSDRASEAFDVVRAELDRRGVIVDEARHVVDDYALTRETAGLARLRTRVYPPVPMQSGAA
jgi:hypothetical protein